jgi:hypothetical protein
MKSNVSESNKFLIETNRCDEEEDGTREEIKKNNFVEKKTETHKIVGLEIFEISV